MKLVTFVKRSAFRSWGGITPQLMGRAVGPRAPIFALMVLTVVACGTENHPTEDFISRDSAGLHIIESLSPAWSDGSAWEVSSNPNLVIGLEDGADPYQFFRVGGATRRDDGVIIVANSGSGELRFFGSDGAHLQSVGRHGAGPGEFHQLSGMRMWRASGDRVLVDDGGNGRINIFSAAGEYRATIRLQGAPEIPRPFFRGPLGDGSWLAMGAVGGGRLQGAPGTIIDMKFRYALYDPEGGARNVVTEVQGRRRYVHQIGGIIHFPYIPLSTDPLVAANDSLVFVLRSGAPELEVWTPFTALLHTLVRWRPQVERLIADIWPRYKTAALEDIPNEERRRRYAAYYERDLPLPELLPVAEDIVVDREGTVWLRRYRLPWSRTIEWDVIASDGRWLGTVATPREVRIFEIGADYVLGRHLDSLGVERIVLHTLRKPSETGTRLSINSEVQQ